MHLGYVVEVYVAGGGLYYTSKQRLWRSTTALTIYLN
jgi:hypothetical protein